MKASKMAVVFDECGRECLSGPGNTGSGMGFKKTRNFKLWKLANGGPEIRRFQANHGIAFRTSDGYSFLVKFSKLFIHNYNQ